MIEKLRLWLKNWLNITRLEKSRTYLAADVGWHDRTVICIMKRDPKGVNNLVDLIDLPSQVPFRDVQSKIKALAWQYGIRDEDQTIDIPYPGNLTKNNNSHYRKWDDT